MGRGYFEFKQFTVHQDQCAMKVNTDGVILAALVENSCTDTCLDIGTGTGLIALMMAQRFSQAKITAVEIDGSAAKQASENFANSPWSGRLELTNSSFQEFKESEQNRYDLIVSNPPYFPDHNKSTDSQRNLALHNDALSFGDLVKGVAKLLKPEGAFWLILPPRQMQDLEKIANFFDLFSTAEFLLSDRPETKVLRSIRRFEVREAPCDHQPQAISIKNTDHSYSEFYARVLKDFLLIF